MKIILTGNTGLIGAEVLTQCLANPAITSIVAISRRDLPIQHPKLKQIQHSDFNSYPQPLLDELKGAEACIWSLGIAMPKTMQEGQRINQEYPLAAAKAFARNRDGKPFRFVYVSGKLVEKDQNKKLWIVGDSRKMRGRTELEMVKLNSPGNEIHIMRPGFVGAKGSSFKDTAMGVLVKMIKEDWLAASLVDVATKGGNQQFYEMDDLMKIGEAIVSKS